MMRVTRPGDPPATSEEETDEWLVEVLADGTRRVTVYNDRGQIVQHGGPPSAIRPRLAVDTAARNRTIVDQTVRDLTIPVREGVGVRP